MGGAKISVLFLREKPKSFPDVVMEESLVDDEYRLGSSSSAMVEKKIILPFRKGKGEQRKSNHVMGNC